MIYYLKLSDNILPVKACFLSIRVYRAPESSVHRAEYAMLSMYRSQYGCFPINLRPYAAGNVTQLAALIAPSGVYSTAVQKTVWLIFVYLCSMASTKNHMFSSTNFVARLGGFRTSILKTPKLTLLISCTA